MIIVLVGFNKKVSDDPRSNQRRGLVDHKPVKAPPPPPPPLGILFLPSERGTSDFFLSSLLY